MPWGAVQPIIAMATEHSPMAFATETKAFPACSPTSTPILDVLRAVPVARPGKLTASEYFVFSSTMILLLTGLPRLRDALVQASSSQQVVVLLAVPVLALISAWLIHQGGHLIAAWVFGFRLAPTNFGRSYDAQRLHACDSLRVGILSLETAVMDHLRRRLTFIFAGGPVAGLVFALVLEFCRDWSHSGVLVQMRVHTLAAFNVLASLASLLPDTGHRANFSDGARLVMLLKNDSKAARLFAILRMQQALKNGVHPRDWDSAWVERATADNDQSRDALTGLWLAYLWTSERQDITSATRYLEDALAVPDACSRALRDRLYLEAAVFQAWFRDNPANAHSWAALIHSGRMAAFEQKRLTIAILWAEGKLFDAFEKVEDLLLALRELPESPARNLVEKSGLEWKHQMKSRMLTRAWRSMYNMSQQVEASAAAETLVSSRGN
jgi:urease gamma subunit